MDNLNGAFNNAGIEGAVKVTTDCTEEEFDRTIAVNVTGVWLCMKYEIQHMLSQGGGSIVNTASAAGLVGFPGLPDYMLLCVVGIDTLDLRVTQRQVFLPEIIIKMQVQQGAVHVEQHCFNDPPINHF